MQKNSVVKSGTQSRLSDTKCNNDTHWNRGF